MLEVNKTNFEAEVLQATGLVMVDFWSPKCEPCMALMPEVTVLAEKYAGKLKFCSLNVIENRRLAMGQKVMGLPVIAFYKDGDKIQELTGEVTGDQIEATIKGLTE